MICRMAKAIDWKIRPTLLWVAVLVLIGVVVPLAGYVRQDSRLAPASPNDGLADTLEGISSQQASAWNRGDIDEFMQHYWKSDDLTFSSGGKTTRGWEATKENYHRRYPTRERMGQLSFDQIEVTSLGDSAALVLGRWQLEREPTPVGGNFSLVFRRIEGRWVIVHDHTSTSVSPGGENRPAKQN